jgi:hypothetical protein
VIRNGVSEQTLIALFAGDSVAASAGLAVGGTVLGAVAGATVGVIVEIVVGAVVDAGDGAGAWPHPTNNDEDRTIMHIEHENKRIMVLPG